VLPLLSCNVRTRAFAVEILVLLPIEPTIGGSELCGLDGIGDSVLLELLTPWGNDICNLTPSALQLDIVHPSRDTTDFFSSCIADGTA
jgi:hypothetical protein